MTYFYPPEAHSRHLYVPGKTQFGKSTTIASLAYQQIKKGFGLCAIDPKPHRDGETNLVELILDYIPEHRKDDVIWLDLDNPVPLDFMDYHSDNPAEKSRGKERLAGELKFLLLKTIDNASIPTIEANVVDLVYSLLSFNENPKTPPDRRATFIDIYRFFRDEERRKEILAGVTDRDLISRWRTHFPHPQDQNKITNRMTDFYRYDNLRAIFDAPQPKLNIAQAIREKKILLVHLGQTEADRVYGTLLISKIRDAAHSGMIPPKQVYYLYCDEFQDFQTSDFARMLSQAGTLGLSMVLAHQYVDQLQPLILKAITGNVSSFLAFRLGHESANALKYEISKTSYERLAVLERGEAIYRDFHGTTHLIWTPKPPNTPPTGYAEYIKKRTLDLYSCPTLQISYDSGNERVNRAAEEKAEPEKDVPLFKNKKKRPRPPK